MRAAARLIAVLILAAAGSAIAQEKHFIDPTPPGSLNPEPLPPLQNPDAPSTPAKELFARRPTPFPGPPRSIGGYSDGCLAGATPLPNNGPSWQVMRLSRNRNWGNPHLVRFIERFAKTRKRSAGTVFWSATCRSHAAGRCSPAIPATKSASTSIFGSRRCLTTYKAARSVSSARPPTWSRPTCSTSIRECGPIPYRAHSHRCTGSGGHPHLRQCRDQEGAVPRGRS